MQADTAAVTGFFHPASVHQENTRTLRMAGYASVFYVRDNHDDIVMPGAFADITHPSDVKLLWQHKPDAPIGVIQALKEDAYGLYMEADIVLASAGGAEAAALLQGGALSGLSIGYRTLESDIDDDTGARLLKKAQLWEISLVTFPANSAANVTAIGDAPKSIRDIERILRTNGCSRTQAKRIAAYGFKSSDTPPLTADETAELRAMAQALATAIHS